MKIFIKKYSEVSGNSFCPEYYHYERVDVIKKLKEKYKDNLFALKNIVNFSSQKSIAKNVETYIGMANIESNTGLYSENNDEKGQGNCNVFNRGEILFNKLRPYLNKVYLAEFSGGCSTEFVVLNSKDDQKISNSFLSIFLLLDCVVNQTKHLMTGNTLPRLQTFDIENLLIPIPPKEIQRQIIDIMDNAYLAKKHKESEARAILDSVDNFLLDELDIILPPKATHDLEKRIFFTKLSTISGMRFDSEYHQSYYTALQNAITKGKYEIAKIRDSVFVNQQLESMEKYDFINYIDLSCIEKENGIVKDTILIDKVFPSRARQRVFKDDLLVSTLSGSMKAIALINEDKENLIASTGFFVISKVKQNLSKDFLISILRIDLFQTLLKREASGSIMSSINYNDFLNLKIPLPPLSVQEKIADEVSKRKTKALNLQKEAKSILESAKMQVEKIIL